MNKAEFCKAIDYSVLWQNSSKELVEQRCQEVLEYGFACICVYPCDVALARSIIGDNASVGAVVGFPVGGNTTSAKIQESLEAIDNGANELDVVMNISRFKDGCYDYVLDELKQIVKEVKNKMSDCQIKVIIETPHFKNRDELAKACELVIASGADYVKQATGLAMGFATGDSGYTEDEIHPFDNTGIDNVKAIREIVQDRIKIKSSGDPKDLDECVYYMQELGVSRVGNDNIPEWLDDVGEDYWKDK